MNGAARFKAFLQGSSHYNGTTYNVGFFIAKKFPIWNFWEYFWILISVVLKSKNKTVVALNCFLSQYFIFHFDGFDQACLMYPGKFAISLWHLKKEVANEVRDLNALAGSNTTLTIYYTSNVLLLLNLFLSQYGIHTKPFSYLINCLFNINLLLLFQVMVGLCKLACFPSFEPLDW